MTEEGLDPLILSMSQIATYIECKKKYELGYVRLLEPKGNDESAMSKGTAFHKLAEHMTTEMWPHLPHVECPQVPPETEKLWEAWWQNKGIEKHDKKRKVLGVEAPIYTPVDVVTNIPGQQVYLRCTFDEIYLDKEGWIVGLDYKTYSTDRTQDVELDFQGRTYVACLQRLFPSYNVRFEYERIRQSPPGTPRGDSKFLRFEENSEGGGKWWQYNKAGDKRKTAELWTPLECYETVDLIPTKIELETLWDETKFNIMELLVRQKAAATIPGAWGRTSSKSSCSFCYFKTMCIADLQGVLDEQTIDLLSNPHKPLEIPAELREPIDLPV